MGADPLHHIVIVGGGAGGLELATRLGDTLGRSGRASITLIERDRTHFWKPHLHEIAAGSIDVDLHAVSYMAQAHWHRFRWRMGALSGLDRTRREVVVAPVFDEDGRRVTAEQRIRYDRLVIAIGSQTNDFGTPGAAAHAIALDSTAQAERFHRHLIDACIRANAQREPLAPGQLHVAIIGAGATGVELSAELRNTTRALVSYGLDAIDPEKDIRLHLLEAAPRILPALPERLSERAAKLLADLGVDVRAGARVAEVTADGVRLADGTFIAAELVVWAAGVKAPEVLKDLAGLESNRLNQLVVRRSLQTTRDDDIYAFGDCAACPWPGARDGPARWVPPRAQAAHQQASHLARELARRLDGKAPRPYTYRDFGSLVSLGEYSTVGNLMSSLGGGTLWVEGLFARLMYVSLYQLHQLALHGPWKTGLELLARLLARRAVPRVKLH
jgi:NADH dehydrogenase